MALLLHIEMLAMAEAGGTGPNVVILLTDDVGWGDVGYNCHNATVCPRTPNIDRVATSDSAVLFTRFYAGAGVCSPTRASVLTGRNNMRGCVKGALPCDHMASGAAECSQGPGLSWNEFTIAEAASKAGMPSLHLGKWHLGDLWDKGLKGAKWPNNQPHHSNPGDHGFTEWFSSQAQLPTSTPNCGCFPPPSWSPPAQQPSSFARSTAGLKFNHSYPGQDCVIAGGVQVNESFVCSTYWQPDPSTRTGVRQLSKKIPGDDGEFMVEQLSAFVSKSVAGGKKFLATLWLHYIHLPHPAMPKYYSQYKFDPDYVGTLNQLDDTFGEIVSVLEAAGVYNDTLLFFTSDNGCHCDESTEFWPQVHCGGIDIGRSSAGLRGCKASNWEGGIRVPGFMVWPNQIKHHVRTDYPAVTHDFLPTAMEAWSVVPDSPDEPLDGVSLLSFAGFGAQPLRREKPIGIWFSGSKAWIDNDLKLIAGSISPGQGCTLEKPYSDKNGAKGPYLYNLTADPTESIDLKLTLPSVYASMNDALAMWTASVERSASLNGCGTRLPPGPLPPPPPPPGPVGRNCTFSMGVCGFGSDHSVLIGVTQQDCCDSCRKQPTCTVAVFQKSSGTNVSKCHIKKETKPGRACAGYTACRARNFTLSTERNV